MAEQEPKEDMLVLYNYTYSYYGQKVLMVLHEKGLEFRKEYVNLIGGEQIHEWFLRLNPRGEVPVLKHGNTIVSDSSAIINYIEHNFTSDKDGGLTPCGGDEEVNRKHSHFTTIIRDLPIPHLTYGSFYHPQFSRGHRVPFILPLRHHMKRSLDTKGGKLRELAKKKEELTIPLLEKAERTEKFRESVEDKRAYEEVLKKVELVVEEVETQLESGQGSDSWLVCSRFLLADIELTVLLERLYLLGLDERFWGENKNPNLAKYYTKVKGRESYRKTMPGLVSHLKSFIAYISS